MWLDCGACGGTGARVSAGSMSVGWVQLLAVTWALAVLYVMSVMWCVC